MVIAFKKFGESLGTRSLGLGIRKSIIENFKLDVEDKIVFDFSEVNIVSNCFADEVFGKLVAEFGLEYIKSKTTFKNINSDIAFSIRAAMNYRIWKGDLE